MKVSIIIPNYNGYKYLETCMKAVYSQTHSEFEIIFVDNASTDGSVEFIKKNYPQIQLIELKQNYGFSKAVNEGIKTASTDLVVLLNNDTEAEGDWLSQLINCISKDARIFSCSSKMLQFFDRNKIDDAGDEYNAFGWAYKRGDNMSRDRYSKDSEIFSTCAGAAIYRRNVFEEIGYFDENFFAYLEDVDLSYRARLYGYRNVYCSSARIYHVGSGTSGSKYNSFKVKLAARNNLYVIFKNMGIFQRIINSPFLLLGFLIKYVFFAKKGFREDYEQGFMEGLKNRRELHRIKFKREHFINYVKIEGLLIRNAGAYFIAKIFG